VRWREKGHQIRYLAPKTWTARRRRSCAIALKDGDVQYVYLDPDYFLEIRRVSQRTVRGSERSPRRTSARTSGQRRLDPHFGGVRQEGRPKTQRFTVRPPRERAGGWTRLRFRRDPDPRRPFRRSSPPATRAGARAEGGGKGAGDRRRRDLGPQCTEHRSAAMSGRIAALAGRKNRRQVLLYVGGRAVGCGRAGRGTTFSPSFDRQPCSRSGPSPSTRERKAVGSVPGILDAQLGIDRDGIYKSVDGGESWTNMGLQKKRRITQIAIDPRNPDTVTPARRASCGATVPDRGLYKTSDAGRLGPDPHRPNLSTGCSTIAVDRRTPDVLFAGLWDFRRKGWTFRSGGNGPDASAPADCSSPATAAAVGRR